MRTPFLSNALWVLLAPLLALGPSRAAAPGKPATLPPLTDKELTQRARFWMHKLRYTADPGENERCRRNLVALGPRALSIVLKEAEGERGKLPFVHWNVCLVLGKMADDQALPYLLRRLAPVTPRELKARPEWAFVRAYAALALGKIKDPARTAVAPLRKFLDQERESLLLRRTAALALGTLNGTEALPVLGSLLLDPKEHATLRGAAALSLGMIRSDAAVAKLHAYWQLGAKRRHGLVDRMAVLALGMQRKKASVPVLRPLLQGDDPELRGSTALVLGWIGERGAAPDVRKLMDDPRTPPFSRCNAAVALNGLGESAAGAAFLRRVLLTTDRGASVGTLAYAAISLGAFFGEENLKVLHRVISTDKHPVVVLNAINALGHRKDRRMVPFLIECFYKFKGTRNEFLRGEIARALFAHPEQEAIHGVLLKGLRDASAYVRKKCAIALMRYGGPRTESALLGVLDDRDESVRGEAAVTLGVLKSQRAAGPLYKRLHDESDWVRMRARKALENILKYGHDEFHQAAGLQNLVRVRLRVVNADLKGELDRLYTQAYQQVLELNKPYKPGAKIW